MKTWLGSLFLTLARRLKARGLLAISEGIDAERYRHRERLLSHQRHTASLERMLVEASSRAERYLRERDEAQHGRDEARRVLGRLYARGPIERSFPKEIAPPHCRWCLQKPDDEANLIEIEEVTRKRPVGFGVILHDADCPFPSLLPFARFGRALTPPSEGDPL